MGTTVANRINRDRNYALHIKFLNGVKRIPRRILRIVELVPETTIKKVFTHSPGFSAIKMAATATVVANALDNKSRRIPNHRLHDTTIKKACVFSS